MTKNWLSVKSTIKELYVVQGKSLAEVTRHLRDDSGFIASGGLYNEDVRVEDDVCTAILILLRRWIDPNTVDSTSYTPLNCFLDSVAWYTGNRPKRLDYLRLLLEHGADSCSGDGHSYPILQALEGPGYTMEEDDEDFDYVFEVICLLMQHFPSSMRGAPRWQPETLHDYLPITPRSSDYFECSRFDALLKQHSGLTALSAAIFRRAAQAVSIRMFLDSQMSLMPL
ncbi:hypothetical protein B0J12DRAFT_766420 [Macrophomina phaseolina]|uniref:Clr5 domain-containing protein n=1 Tax=Macrophomina phaseolina TaxID=35725 RepID=A0ABQ8GMU5_9PEZI|nr:hypothetical protein B0J12DRAFT_766420 [Macrophomina phaseolina]